MHAFPICRSISAGEIFLQLKQVTVSRFSWLFARDLQWKLGGRSVRLKMNELLDVLTRKIVSRLQSLHLNL